MSKVDAVEMTNVVVADEAKQVDAAAADEEFQFTGSQIGCMISEEGERGNTNLWQAGAAEFLGMMFFLFFTIATVNSSDGYSNGLDGGRVFMISNVFGFMIAILVYVTFPVSGGNLNPAVSLALFVTKRISFTRFLVYVACQCAGAFVGCTFVHIIFQGDGYVNAINSIAPAYTMGQAFLGEVFGTALLVFCVMGAVDSNNAEAGRVNTKQSLGVLMIGLCVTMAHCVLIPITNCSINPARALATSLVSGEWGASGDHAVMWFGPFVGALFSALAYELILKQRPKTD